MPDDAMDLDRRVRFAKGTVATFTMNCGSAAGAVFGLICLLSNSVSMAGQVERESAIAIEVHQSGETIVVDVILHVAVSPREAWDVLADFDHMAAIVSNLESSKVVARSSASVIVEQRGKATRGPLSFAFNTIREVKLTPYSEIHAHMLSGSLKSLEGTTRLTPEGAGTLIINHGEFVTDVWVPPVIGPYFIEAETRKQFEEMRSEMLRRIQTRVTH